MASGKANKLSTSQKGDKSVEVQESWYRPARIKAFAGEVKTEFEKIAWPDKKHTVGSTAVVVILVVILSFYLGAVDLFLGKLISYILR